MKLMSMSVLFGLLLCGLVALAETSSTAPADAPPVNKFCAVETDNPVNPQVFVIYKGQKIAFCCGGCIAKFNADPDKYVAKMK